MARLPRWPLPQVLPLSSLVQHPRARLGVQEETVRLGDVFERDLGPALHLGQDRSRREQLKGVSAGENE